MIPLPPHRTKGPGVLGATPERPNGPFGRWPDPAADEDTGEPTAAWPTARDGRTG
ncbi:hypothetical protein ABT112_33275 [Streptomyces sp. NPDC002055]|uniref:hypothetical protein n=1 Tax=Streptomyces sp. NPDC002055 TaxID=3154534 RepID=UPI003324BF3B